MTGPRSIPENGHPLVAGLMRFVEEKEISISELARRAGVGRATPRRWVLHSPTLAKFDAVLAVLGMELCIRPRFRPVKPKGRASCK